MFLVNPMLAMKYHLPAPNGPEYKHNIQNVLPVSEACSNSTTVVDTKTRAVYSVGLNTVGSPGTCPNHGNTKVVDCSNCHEVLLVENDANY